MKVARHEEIVAKEFPEDSSETLLRRRGQFHEVVIGSNKVVSIARTQPAATRLPQRAKKLTAIADLLPEICIPHVISLHHDYLVMTRVPDELYENLARRFGSTTAAIIPQLGGLLQAFSRVNKGLLVGKGVTTTPCHRWSTFAIDVKRDLWTLMSDEGRKRAHQEIHAVTSIPLIAESLVHGDLGGDNIHWKLDSGCPVLAGVLDWDEAHLGDVAVDLAALQSTFGKEAVGEVVRNMEYDEDIFSRVDAIRGTFAMQQALAGFHDGDQAELADGLREYV